MKPHFALFATCCVLYALVAEAALGSVPRVDQTQQKQEQWPALPQSHQQANTNVAAPPPWQAKARAVRTGTQRRSPPTNYNRTTNTASPVCEYQAMMSNIHDRVGVLASLDEDQRNRLEAISLKITQFEASNLGRLDSISVKQNDMQSRLDALEHIQRLVRTTVDELKGESDEVFRAIAAHDAGIGGRQRHRRYADFSRLGRQTPVSVGATSDAGMMPGSLVKEIFTTSAIEPTVNQKLDALATLLASTAASVRNLRAELQTNITKLSRTTKNLRRAIGGPKSANLPANTLPVSDNEVIDNCLQADATSNGIVRLQLTPASDSFYARCENDGWLVVLNRFSDNVNFERDWLEYKAGFGNLAGEFFIGLDKLYALTAAALHEVRIVLEDHAGNVAEAGYSLFAISSEEELYALSLLGEFDNGSAGDSLSYHAGAKFSTFDHDNDGCIECNCAAKHKGGWWFNACATSNLMGNYFVQNYDNVPADEGIFWRSFPKSANNYSLKRVQLLIRPVNGDADGR